MYGSEPIVNRLTNLIVSLLVVVIARLQNLLRLDYMQEPPMTLRQGVEVFGLAEYRKNRNGAWVLHLWGGRVYSVSSITTFKIVLQIVVV